MNQEEGWSLERAVANWNIKDATADKPTGSVCAVCQGFGEEGHPRGWINSGKPGSFSPGYVYLHYPNFVVLSESARNGCQVCTILLNRLRKEYFSERIRASDKYKASKWDEAWAKAEELERTRDGPFDLDRDTDEVARLLENVPDVFKDLRAALDCSYRILLSTMTKDPRRRREPEGEWTEIRDAITLQAIPEFRNKWYFQVKLSSHNEPADPLVVGNLYGPAHDLLSYPHIALVRRWMETCATEHHRCRAHLGPAQRLPTRVLEMSSEPDTGAITGVRLVETHNSVGTYACLSYCWGPTPQTSKTVTTNLARYLDSIPLEDLPSTILDCLRFLCKLGFRYVWVDALCIVQDDNEDWLREASKMAAVYGAASLTLATHVCEDNTESFLHKRESMPRAEALSRSAAALPFVDENTGEKRVLHLWDRLPGDVRGFLDSWVLTTGERSSSWLERAWTFQEWWMSPRVLHVRQMTMWDCFEGRGDEMEHRFLTESHLGRAPSRLVSDVTWCSIVQDFTSRRITNTNDRLPALAGMAEEFRKASGYQYLAGMWLEELPTSLLWRKYDDYLTAPSAYRAPSWSWASLEGAVAYTWPGDEQTGTKVSVISAHCEYYPPGTMSTVTSGWLDIEGPMCLVTGRNTLEDCDCVRLFTNGNPLDGDKWWWAALDLEDTCSSEDVARSEIYLLKVVQEEDSDDDSPGSELLILQKTERSGDRDTFRRLGVADSVSPGHASEWLTASWREQWETRSIRLV
ncbi:hypothetical protein VPNG_02965 [Cytospora leucostoma]|uniref:Heterokaryon incompatibility domain-containing protein n=1 Tax=Cytospora leucostoma TaxID=1230097 RepID=A0A423XG49_9PEZI|nr:hypothetical protein VPNG_02965 [Cytospora leucostoma]